MRKRKTTPLALFILLATVCSFLFASYSYAITITGSDTITTNSSASYSSGGCDGSVSWSVTGTSASISQNGVLTTGSASCGGITVTARCSDGSIATKTVRVTNAGQWVPIESCHGGDPPCGGDYYSWIVGKYRYSAWILYKYDPEPCEWCCTEGCCPTYGGPIPPPKVAIVCGAQSSAKYEWKCLPCTNGQTISCYTGTGGTQGIGVCKAGTQTCVNGQWGACQGEVLPTQEICGDNLDNNCNGQVDEGCCEDNDGDGHYAISAGCPEGDDCNDNNSTIYLGAAEICDGEDNNCNGQIDEGFSLGNTCSVGVGACKRDGFTICSLDGAGTVCNVTPGEPSPEICDGIDNDCNGVIDDNLQPQKCYSGPQGTENVGVCKAGTQTCANGQWGACQGEITPQKEICGDGLDNNCDGRVDEGCVVCVDNDGDGHYAISPSCPQGDDCNDSDPTIYPGAPELCDGKDHNCNGQVDEGCDICRDGETKACAYTGPQGTENVGECKAGTKTCTNGQWGACQEEVLPQTEICDGLDNDCNGIVDDLCPSPALSVPLVKQCDSRWKTDPYDDETATIYTDGSCTGCICSEGCALTSAVMVLRYYGVTTGTDGYEVNPANLNDWLNGEPDGYYGTKINWNAITRYSGNRIAFSKVDGQDDVVLDDDLCNMRPPIVNVPGHFVVATGRMCSGTEETWTINDPGHSRTTLKDYGNTYLGMRRTRSR